jgi:hypothetical protein
LRNFDQMTKKKLPVFFAEVKEKFSGPKAKNFSPPLQNFLYPPLAEEDAEEKDEEHKDANEEAEVDEITINIPEGLSVGRFFYRTKLPDIKSTFQRKTDMNTGQLLTANYDKRKKLYHIKIRR